MEATYRAWLFVQERILGYFAALTMLGVTLLALVEIFRRYVQGQTFYWGQDAVTYFMVAAAFVYFGVSQAQRTHLAVTILPDWLLDRGRRRLALAIRAFGSLLCVLFVVAFVSWGLPAAERTMALGRMTESMIIPLWPFQYVLLAGMTIMGITLLFQLYRDVMRLCGRNVFPWEPDRDQMEL